jgi:predicted nucleic acid-binding protein
MIRLVVDASVAAKWFVPEIHQAAALRLMDDRYELLSPDLITAEFGNILWKKARRHEITDHEASEAVRLFLQVSLKIIDARSIIGYALELAMTTGCSVYDCLYLASALLENCRLVTADRKLYNALKEGPFSSNLLWVEQSP